MLEYREAPGVFSPEPKQPLSIGYEVPGNVLLSLWVMKVILRRCQLGIFASHRGRTRTPQKRSCELGVSGKQATSKHRVCGCTSVVQRSTCRGDNEWCMHTQSVYRTGTHEEFTDIACLWPLTSQPFASSYRYF